MFNFKSQGSMTIEEIIKQNIDNFEVSPERQNMINGQNYYCNNNSINNREIYCYVDEQKIVDETKVNNKLSHAFMKLLVDEKVGYLLGKSPSYSSLTDNFEEHINDILDDEFDDILNEAGIETSNKGIAWLQAYINSDKELKFKVIPSEQIVALWKDEAHTELDSIIRYYFKTVYEGQTERKEKKVEYWTDDGVQYYVQVDGKLIYDIEVNEGKIVKNSFSIVPFIPIKNNSKELNDLTFIKQLIDDYDLNTSDTSNNLAEIQSLIYVLKNYSGTDIGEFMKDLRYYKAIKTEADGGVDTLKANLDIEASERHLDRLKKDIYTFGQGVNMDTDKFGANPSGVALKFLYSGLDLKCNNLERKLKKAFQTIFWFIVEYLKTTGKGTFDYKDAKVSFNRNMITNENEVIQECQGSLGMISNKTIMEHHPWVSDTSEEEQRLEQENKEDSLDYEIPEKNKPGDINE